MKPQVFFFTGRSGCGKGTQVKLLIDSLKLADPSRKILYIQTGAELRRFMEGPSLTQKLTKDILDKGGLPPEFVAIYQWIKIIVEQYSGEEHLIFDGTPRRLHEARMFGSMVEFYNLGKPWVFNIEIDNEEAVKRLLGRKRFDDTEEDIRARLSWYETEVVPVVEYFRTGENYHFANIDGMRSVEEIHKEIAEKLRLG